MSSKEARRKERHEYQIYQLSDTDPAKKQLVSHVKESQKAMTLSGTLLCCPFCFVQM
jgi:hypothetical protein